jgi:predicted methyltransferase
LFSALSCIALLAACDSGTSVPATPAAPLSDTPVVPGLAEIADGEHRAAENRARNAWRHPVETLEFFGLDKGQTVVEIWPAGGWYTEVIAPYLNDDGKYIAAGWDPNSKIEFIRKGVEKYQAKLDEYPDLYGNVQLTVLMPPDQMDFVPEGSVDMIVTFRNIHNWMGRDSAEDMFAAMHKALKSGGTLGVVEHRGNPDVPQDPKAATGYVNEDYAIALAEKAGFTFVAKSEINANSKDTKDHAKGVWTLPPTLRAGDEPQYHEIGESDRFTLKFVK